MSYDLKVLRDNPIGYWSFNNTLNDLTLDANNAYSNDDVLNLTPVSAGDVWTNSTGSNDSVTVGQFYTATSYAKTTTGSRNFYTRIDWYKSDNTLITTNFGSTVSANNTSWTQASVTASAPASAIYAITTITVQGATGITDTQFVKSVVFNNSLLPVSRFVSGANTTLSNTKASGYYTSPPIIANSGSSLKILNSSSVVISNMTGKYEAFSKNFENKSLTIGFWFSLNNALTGNGYGTTPYTNNQLNLFSIKSGSVVIGKVYYDYLSNTIRFSITGTGNTDAYYVVNDLDKQFYVVVNYSNQSSEIIVNGVSGETGLILDTSTMSSYAKTSLSFVIDGSSITGSSTLPTNFLISSLAFFDYKLSLDQIRSHMLWAGNTEKPIFQSNISASTSIFNFNINSSDYGTHKVISNNDFNTLGTITNLVASNKGLQPVIVPDTTFNTNYDSTASYTISSASGIGWSGSAGVDFSNLSNYFNLYNGLVIGGYLYRTAASTAYTSASGEYIFGISNVNNGQYLFLEYKNVSSSWQYNLNLYNPSDLTTTTLLSAYTASFKDDNFALLINSNFIQLEILSGSVGSSASVLTSSSTSYLPISLGSNSSLTVGNSYHNPKPFLSKINYVNLGDLSITSSSFRSIYTSSYTQTAMTFMLNMSNTLDPFFVSQHGEWEYVLPSANISNSYLLGTSFDWKTMDNCKVTISYDGGNTFSSLNRAQIASGYDLTQPPQNLVINVDIYTNYRLDNNYQSFNNFTYTFYNDLTLYSDAEYYKITPASSTSLSNYIPQIVDSNIMSRPKNFGLKFVGDNSKATGYATINVPSTSSYSAIEFWYRPDANTNRINLISNPSFETNTFFNQVLFSSMVRQAGGFVGSYSLKVTSTSSVSVFGMFPSSSAVTSARFPVTPNQYYTFSSYIRDTNTLANFIVSIEWYTSATGGTPISISSEVSASASTSSFNRFSVTGISPSTALYAAPTIYTASPVAIGLYFNVDALLFESSRTSNSYFDGSSVGASWLSTANNSQSASGINFILNNISSSAVAPAIWIDNTSKFKSLGGTLYINGSSVSDGAYLTTVNEVYHIALILSASNNSNLYLNNGAFSGSSVNTFSTYGYLQFWNSTPTSANILNRYNQFIGKVPARITDNNTSKIFSISTPSRVVATKIG